jgi:hypothetical protein
MPQAQRTLKEIINAVQAEYALPISPTIVGNTNDKTAQQLLAFAQAELEELGRKDINWTNCTLEYNIVVSPPLETTGDVTENSPIITNIPDTSTLEDFNFVPAGSYIPVGARVIDTSTPGQVTMNMQATGTATNTPLTFSKDMYPEPADFDRFIGSTWWDRTNRWQLLGPMSPQVDQWHMSGIVATGPRRFFRQVGPYPNVYRIWPPPAELENPLQLVYEYQTNKRVKVHGQSFNFAFLFANDDDVPLLDDRVIIAGIKWRFWEQKGFNWLSKKKEYTDMVDRYMARDGGSSKLSLVRQPTSILISPNNVQDGFFPGPTGPNTE